jgi:hypothetical protein
VARNQNGEALRHDALKGVCAKHQVATTSERRCSLVTRFSSGRAGLLAREGSRGRVARVRCGGLHRRGSSGDMVRKNTWKLEKPSMPGEEISSRRYRP